MNSTVSELTPPAKEDLWAELRLLQPIIDKFDTITIQLKSWFVTSFTALIGISLATNNPKLCLLNLVLVGAFYVVEVSYRNAHDAFLNRSKEIQSILRGEKGFQSNDAAPNIDRYLKHGFPEWQQLGKFLFEMLGQPRVSAVYWFSTLITAVILIERWGTP